MWGSNIICSNSKSHISNSVKCKMILSSMLHSSFSNRFQGQYGHTVCVGDSLLIFTIIILYHNILLPISCKEVWHVCPCQEYSFIHGWLCVYRPVIFLSSRLNSTGNPFISINMFIVSSLRTVSRETELTLDLLPRAT